MVKKKKNTAEVFTNNHCKWAGLWMLELFFFNQPSLLGNVPLLSVASPSLLVPALSLYSRHFLQQKKCMCAISILKANYLKI